MKYLKEILITFLALAGFFVFTGLIIYLMESGDEKQVRNFCCDKLLETGREDFLYKCNDKNIYQIKKVKTH